MRSWIVWQPAWATGCVTINEVVHWLALPAASLTVIVTAFVPSPTKVPGVGFCVNASILVGVQLSVVTTAFVNTGTLAWPLVLATTIIGGAHWVIVGDWLSTTITNCVQVELLPQRSVAVQITAFVQIGRASC